MKGFGFDVQQRDGEQRASEAELDQSASASDAGSTTTTFSTNPNSIFSNAATVRFGNVLSLEDFKGCPCPLDDIMEHEQQRDNRSNSPRSARADKTSQALSPVNDDDLDIGDFALLSFDAGGDGKSFVAENGTDDEAAAMQAAMLASLMEPNHHAPGQGPSGSRGRLPLLHNQPAPDANGQDSSWQGPAGAHNAMMIGTTVLSSRARGKQPMSLGAQSPKPGPPNSPLARAAFLNLPNAE